MRRVRSQLDAGQVIGARLPVAAPGPAYATAAPAPVSATAAPAPVSATAAPAPVSATAAPAPAAPAGPAPSSAAPLKPVTSPSTSHRPFVGAPNGMTVYRRSKWRRPLTVLGSIVVVAAGAALGVALIAEGGHVVRGARSSVQEQARARAAARAERVPNVPVAVLNATPITGAAHDLAAQLQREGVTVSEVGNVSETRPPGLEVLYGPNEQAQATRLARLLKTRSPTIAPIDPVTQGAAGSGAQLVVVIT